MNFFFTGVVTLLLHVAAEAQQFTVQPESVVQAEGLEAVFECLYPGARGYDWLINGTPLPLPLPPGVQTLVPSQDSPTARLIIPATPQYNNTVVQCEADVRINTSRRFEVSSMAKLTANVISSMSMNMADGISISWTNFTNLTYCVEVNQTVLGSTETVPLDPVRGLTGTQYTFSYPNHSVCDRFSFTVTPTEGGRRGTSSQPVTGFFTQARGIGGEVSISQGNLIKEKLVTFTGQIPDCTKFTFYKVTSDLPDTPTSGSITDTQFNGSLTFSLPTDKVAMVNVTLTDYSGIDLIFENILTRTTDIQDLLISAQVGYISVSVLFAGGSLSPGALICVMPVLTDGSLDFANLALTVIQQGISVNITVLTGTYRVFAFDLEEKNIPRMPVSLVADVETVDVLNGTHDVTLSPPTTNVDITAFKLPSGSIEVTCSDVSLNCLVLVQSTDNPDKVGVGFINSIDDGGRTNVTSFGAFNVSVVVFTWKKGESIFSGQLSHVCAPGIPATTVSATTSNGTSSSTSSGVSNRIDTGLIVGLAIIGIVVFLIVIVAMVIIILVALRWAGRRNKKVFNTSQDPYSRIRSSDSDSVPTNGGTTEPQVAIPLQSVALYDVARPEHMASDELPPSYDVIRKEHMEKAQYDEVPRESGDNPSPQYETVASARTGTTSPATADPSPLPPPKITEGPDAPPLPLPLDPESSTDQSISKAPPLPPRSEPETSASIEESVRSNREAPIFPPPIDPHESVRLDRKTPPLPPPLETSSEEGGATLTEEGVDEVREKPTTKPVQYTLVEPKSAPNPESREVIDPSKVVYAQVDKKKLKPKSQATPVSHLISPPPPPSPDTVRLELHPLADQWEDMAKALDVDEDKIDDIFTLNENNQLRLYHLVEVYFQNHDYEHSWGEIVRVLMRIGENKMAEKIKRDKLQESVQSSQFASVV